MRLNEDQLIDDYILYTVLAQPILVILQFLLLFVYAVPEELTTKYRVLFTALPLSLAIVLCFKRKPKLFFETYLIILLFLLIQSILYPSNSVEIWRSTTRFLLPIIVPSALCLMSLKSGIDRFEEILYKISWIIVGIMLFFVYCFFTGRTVFVNYNMALAYALLLPAITLYKRKNWYSILSSVFLLLCMLIFGSRGPLIVTGIYIVYDLVQVQKKNLIYLFIYVLFLIAFLPFLAKILDSFGFSSRTLTFLLSGNMIASEGRDEIYTKVYKLIEDNLLFGTGIFGDRVHLDELCHNIVLEVMVDYGIIFGTLIILIVSICLFKIYHKLNYKNKNRFIKYFVAFIIPLLFSDSYLICIYFGLFWGVVYLLQRTSKNTSHISDNIL